MTNKSNQDKLIEAITSDVERFNKANNLFTNSLEYLEHRSYGKAKETILKAFKYSDSIEQRFALQMLLLLAEEKDNELTNKSIKIAYKNQ